MSSTVGPTTTKTVFSVLITSDAWNSSLEYLQVFKEPSYCIAKYNMSSNSYNSPNIYHGLSTFPKLPYVIPTKWILSPFLQMRKPFLDEETERHDLPTDQDNSFRADQASGD